MIIINNNNNNDDNLNLVNNDNNELHLCSAQSQTTSSDSEHCHKISDVKKKNHK